MSINNHINSQKRSEAETKEKIITKKIKEKGWLEENIRFEWKMTDGKMDANVKKRQKSLVADYVLFYKDNPLVVVEAKRLDVPVYSGIQQAIKYARLINARFAFATNGIDLIQHDLVLGTENKILIDEMSTKQELIDIFEAELNDDYKKMLRLGFKNKSSDKGFEPRYYQINSINEATKAISQGKDRVLLVLATGTGKTYIASQIIYKLIASGLKKKVLFLADRTPLLTQTISDSFKIFEKEMVKIDSDLLNDKSRLSSYKVYLSTYQQLMGDNSNEFHYKKFDRDFFDVIIIDEAHRGSADEDSAWRKILDYFNQATHIGLTATPKPEKNYDYFGKPIYVYSLKQGIEDGFLAPYNIINVKIDIDEKGYKPHSKNQTDDNGKLIQYKTYYRKDQESKIVIAKRTPLVAKYVSDYLKSKNDRMAKTIFFCENTDHAARMRQALIDENQDTVALNNDYVVRITSDDDKPHDLIDKFISVHEPYPVLATTSKMLTTGVDTKMCKYIIIDAEIESPIEFKQIIGRGTRLLEKHGKTSFTIIDFRNVTKKMFEPDFDGIPEQEDEDDIDVRKLISQKMLKELQEKSPRKQDHLLAEENFNTRYYVSGVDVNIMSQEKAFLDIDGKLIKGSQFNYFKDLILNKYSNANEFKSAWLNITDLKDEFSYFVDNNNNMFEIFKNNQDDLSQLDDYDVVMSVVYSQQTKTKQQRVDSFKNSLVYQDFKLQTKDIVNILLEKYLENDIHIISSPSIFRLNDFTKLGGAFLITKSIKEECNLDYEELLKIIKSELYKE